MSKAYKILNKAKKQVKMIPTLEDEALEVFNETLKDNNLSKIKIHYPIDILEFDRGKNKYLFEPVCEEPLKMRRVSYKNLALGRHDPYLVLEELKKGSRFSHKLNIEMPLILGLGKLVDENNIPVFSKRKSWYVLPKKRLEELCEVCYNYL